MNRSFIFLVAALAGLSSMVSFEGVEAQEPPAETQRRDLTLEDIYSPDAEVRLDFAGSVPTVRWIDENTWLERRGSDDDAADADADSDADSADAEQTLMRVDARSGKAAPWFDHERMVKKLAALPGMDEKTARKLTFSNLSLDPDNRLALINHADDLFLYDLVAGEGRRLTFGPSAEVGAEFSPDGRFVSFIRDYNMHLLEVESGRERALTDGGSSELFFGRLDWVYQEEVYGRGNFKGYWWSPDSRHLAYLKLDESPVREFTVIDHLPTELTTEVTNYPKAGSPNPSVTLGVISALGGETQWVDTSKYQSIQHLIVRVGWTPDSSKVVFQVQDREQRWLELNLAEPKTGKSETLIKEESPAFVNVIDDPRWLADGGFLWRSERTGYQHIYRYDAEHNLVGPLTQGEWEVRSLYGFDGEQTAERVRKAAARDLTSTLAAPEQKAKAKTQRKPKSPQEQSSDRSDSRRSASGPVTVYIGAMKDDPIAENIYALPLDGGEMVRLSERPGTHSPVFSPELGAYYDRWSNVTTPTQARLYGRDGKELRVVDENPVEALAKFRWSPVERLQVPTRDGFLMEAMIIKPPDFDPTKKYPVLQYNYGGPHSPVVRDAWGGQRYAWHQMLAQRGYIIWMCDNRSASGKGIAPTWEAYLRMGEIELRDIEDGLDWLGKQPWVDTERLGIWGWSYGGFMASYALTHSDRFKAGIAGAPVTDWRLYDSIYTERYMRMPQNNLEGYDATSVVKAAKDLSGSLLILHGTMDDNVHMQNSIQLIYELQKAGKDFEVMVYPKSRHGVRDKAQVFHLQRVMTDFIERKL